MADIPTPLTKTNINAPLSFSNLIGVISPDYPKLKVEVKESELNEMKMKKITIYLSERWC